MCFLYSGYITSGHIPPHSGVHISRPGDVLYPTVTKIIRRSSQEMKDKIEMNSSVSIKIRYRYGACGREIEAPNIRGLGARCMRIVLV